MAYELLEKYRSVHLRGPLPKLEELGHTRFVRIPNDHRAVIVYLDANSPPKQTGYCFLQGNSADMDTVESSDKAYRAAYGVRRIEDLPQEIWDKILTDLPSRKDLVALNSTSKALHFYVHAELKKEPMRQEKTSELVQRVRGLENIPRDDCIAEFQAIVAKALDKAPVTLLAEHIAVVVRAALERIDGFCPLCWVRSSQRPKGALAALEGMVQLVEHISDADQLETLKNSNFWEGTERRLMPDIKDRIAAHIRIASIVAKISDQKLKAEGIIVLISRLPINVTPFAPVVNKLVSLVNSIVESELPSELAQKISNRTIRFAHSYRIATEAEKPIMKTLGEKLISLTEKHGIETPFTIPWRNES